jgi:PAS domain S-box-containing protein
MVGEIRSADSTSPGGADRGASSRRAPAPGVLEILDEIIRAETVDDLLARVTSALAERFDAERCVLMTQDPVSGDCVGLPPGYGIDAATLRAQRIPMAECAALFAAWPPDRPVIANDLRRAGAPRVPPLPAFPDESCVLAARLCVDGVHEGRLRISDRRSGAAFTAEDEAALESLVGPIALKLRHLRGRERNERRLRALTDWLHRLLLEITSEEDESLLREGIAVLADVMETSYAAIALPDASGRLSRFIHTRLPGDESFPPAPPVGRGLLGGLLRSGEIVRIDDVTRHPLFSGFPRPHPDMGPFIGVAIRGASGAIGRVYLAKKRGLPPFTREGESYIRLFADGVGAALELARRAKVLEVSEARFAKLVASGIIGVIGTDLEGRIHEANDAFLRMVGHDRADLEQGRLRWDVMPPPEHRAASARAVESLYASGVAPQWETEFFRRDGTRVPVIVGMARLTPKGDRCVAFVLDVSDRRRAEDALAKSQAQLRHAQKMDAVGRLAGGIAHDFNNLLTAIIGHADLALAALAADDSARAEIAEVQRASRRAADLTGQLLAFSRRQVMKPQVTDIRRIVLDVEKMLGRLIGEDVRNVTSLPPEPCFARVDPSQLEQVIVNLAVNARDAMPGGGVLTIAVDACDVVAPEAGGAAGEVAPGRYVTLSVRDTGTGISEAVRTHLFEPFFTTKERGRGTGLGLATVYGIVAQSGGAITVHSEVGRGSEFRIFLPRCVAEAASPPAVTANGAHVRGGNETVLLAEDDEIVRRLATRVLESRGYRVLPTARGRETLEVARAHAGAIDVLLTDVIMPEMSGPDIAREVVNLRPGARVIFMSGYTGGELERHGIAVGAVNLLSKPFAPRDLLVRVREVLDVGA